MPDIPSQAGIGYFPPGQQPAPEEVAQGLDPVALLSSLKIGVPNAPALSVIFAETIIKRVTAPPPAGSSGGGGPNGFSPGRFRDASAPIFGTQNPGDVPPRAPGSWTGAGPYLPPYGPPVGSGNPPPPGPGGAPDDAPFVIWEADAGLPNARLFSPIIAQSTAPTNVNTLWLDTSTTPGIIKFYNGTSWIVLAGAVGATGPAGAPGPASAFTYRGNWDETVAYVFDDVVFLVSNGSSYVCTTPIAGAAPGAGVPPSGDLTHWQPLALAGTNGTPGLTGTPGPAFNIRGAYSGTSTYSINDCVYYLGSTFVATSTVGAGNPPPTPPATVNSNWQMTAAGGTNGTNGTNGLNWKGAYNGATVYAVNDGVIYLGSAWIATAPGAGTTPPTLPTTFNGQWTLLVQIGGTGPAGSAGPTGLSAFTRTTAASTSGTLAVNASDGTTRAALGQTAALYQVSTNYPARVRLYATPSYLTADASRPITSDPTGDHGCLLEVVTTTGFLTVNLSPSVVVDNQDSGTLHSLAMSVTNLDTVSRAITVTFQKVTLE